MARRVIKWSQKNVVTEALLYPSVRVWERVSPKSVRAARRLGLYEFCCRIIVSKHHDLLFRKISIEHGEPVDHLLATHKFGRRRSGSSSAGSVRRGWTMESLIASALPYERFGDWKRACPAAHKAAGRRGLIPLIARMLGGNHDADVATHDLSDAALLRRAEETGARSWAALRRENGRVYRELRRRVLAGSLETRFGAPRSAKWNRRWDLEKLRAECLLATSMRQLRQRHPGAFHAAKRLGVLDELTRMYFTQTESGRRLRLVDCAESAAGQSSFRDWILADRQAALQASRRGWLQECCHHMDDAQLSCSSKKS
jgi:hypothetical protein